MLDRTLHTSGIDIITHLKWFEQKNNHATSEILQSALQSHTHGQTRSTQHRDKRSGLNANHTQHGNDNHHFQSNVGQ